MLVEDIAQSVSFFVGWGLDLHVDSSIKIVCETNPV
jgi:hypothetical protein